MNKNIINSILPLLNYPQVYLEKSYKASSKKDVVFHKKIEKLLIEQIILAAKTFYPNPELNLFVNSAETTEFLDLTPENIQNFLKNNLIVYIPYSNTEYRPEAFKGVHSAENFQHTVFSSLFPLDIDECEITFLKNGIRIKSPGEISFFTLSNDLFISCEEKIARKYI